jgi:hypothetical protein
VFVAKDVHSVETRLARLESGARRLLAPDYHFLLNGFVDGATLDQASRIATEWGVLPHMRC